MGQFIKLRNVNHGFTVMEVLLVVAIIGIITSIGAPLFFSFQNKNELDVATNTLAQYLYIAQSNSRNEFHDCRWGVNVNGQAFTLYCGDSYASRQVNYDNSYIIPSNLNVSNNFDFNFSKLFGIPAAPGSIGLDSGVGNTSTVTLNPKGMVDY